MSGVGLARWSDVPLHGGSTQGYFLIPVSGVDEAEGGVREQVGEEKIARHLSPGEGEDSIQKRQRPSEVNTVFTIARAYSGNETATLTDDPNALHTAEMNELLNTDRIGVVEVVDRPQSQKVLSTLLKLFSCGLQCCEPPTASSLWGAWDVLWGSTGPTRVMTHPPRQGGPSERQLVLV